jgi:hypothetical protein
MENYNHPACKNGDRIGVFVDFKNQAATLRFTVNETFLDFEMASVAGPLSLLVSFLNVKGTATLIPTQQGQAV